MNRSGIAVVATLACVLSAASAAAQAVKGFGRVPPDLQL
jgi:hypothetical protein